MNVNKMTAPLALIVLTALSGTSIASDVSNTTKINLLAPLVLNEATKIEFNTVPSEHVTCSTALSSTLTLDSNQTCIDTVIPDVFKLEGSNASINISVSADGLLLSSSF